MITLTEFSRETYGHDVRSINKHAERCYRDANGQFYVLSRTLDGIPPFFESYGPFKGRSRKTTKDCCRGSGWRAPCTGAMAGAGGRPRRHSAGN